MLLRGLLYFMVHVNRQCPQFADKSCTFLLLRCPFPPCLQPSPTSLLPPKLPIKTNLSSREIKPTWLRSGTNSKYPIVLSIHCILPLPLCLSLSLCHSLKLTTLRQLWISPWPPPAPHCRWMCSCKRGLPQYGYCVHWTFIWMGAWSPLANSIAQLLASSQKIVPFFRFSSLSQRAVCQLGYDWTRPSHSGAPSISHYTSSPSGIIWESINLKK